MLRCRICTSELAPFISFGKMPLANGFLRMDEFPQEEFSELAVAFCEHCGMVQLTKCLQPDRLFHKEYPFFTASSARMSVHFLEWAKRVIKNIPGTKKAFVIEIGSNDGTLLRHFANAGIRHLGVEPSHNVAEIARNQGVNTDSCFFNEDSARRIAARDGQADVILAANCFCHIEDLQSLAAGLRILLKPDGIAIFEDPYLGEIVRLGSYDQIYDEHAFYFSVTSVLNWLKHHDLEVVDAQPQPVHGGSMRYTVAHRGARIPSPYVEELRRKELEAELDRPETYLKFFRRIQDSRTALVDLLRGLRRQGKRIVGYGATSKSTTVLNFCGIGPDLVEFISDTTTLKQGKYSPGVHIPIRSPQDFHASYPDFALLLAWNHADEIFAKEHGFTLAGGKWIRYVPDVNVV